MQNTMVKGEGGGGKWELGKKMKNKGAGER